MKKLSILFLIISSLAINLPFAQAQRRNLKPAAATPATQRSVDQITAAQMRALLTFIASDEMEGRDTPSRGLDTTAKFIAMNLTRWGFKPAGDVGTFFQRIALRRDIVDTAQTRVEFKGQTLTAGDD